MFVTGETTDGDDGELEVLGVITIHQGSSYFGCRLWD